MTGTRARASAVTLALMAVAACGAPRAPTLSVSPSVPEGVAGVLERMPASSAAREDDLADRLLRQGPEAIDTVVAMLGSTEADDDTAARYALGSLARRVARPLAGPSRELFVRRVVVGLESHRGERERRFLVELLQLAGGAESVAPLAALLEDEALGDTAARALVSVGGESARVAIVQALQRHGAEPRPGLVAAAGELEARGAIPVLREQLRSEDPEVVEAAAAALARMAEPATARDVVDAISRAGDASRARLAAIALRGASDLAGSGRSEVGVEVARTVLEIGRERADEAVQLAALRTLADLAPAAGAEALADPELRAGSSPRMSREIARLEAELSRRRERQRRVAEEERQGFVPLFNGEDLEGWTGATDGYFVAGGAIVCDPRRGGNLYTEAEYADFVLRFEFRLTPGANNGLAIRAPLEGDPAYVGLELQILDNPAVAYSDLEPYQYHGSIYGVAPAERGHLAPVGEWNEQEVVVDGRRIRVTLNGTVILDVDLDEVADPEPADGRDHPGLSRDRGHIGFLGHGHRVGFRDIRIRTLE